MPPTIYQVVAAFLVQQNRDKECHGEIEPAVRSFLNTLAAGKVPVAKGSSEPSDRSTTLTPFATFDMMCREMRHVKSTLVNFLGSSGQLCRHYTAHANLLKSFDALYAYQQGPSCYHKYEAAIHSIRTNTFACGSARRALLESLNPLFGSLTRVRNMIDIDATRDAPKVAHQLFVCTGLAQSLVDVFAENVSPFLEGTIQLILKDIDVLEHFEKKNQERPLNPYYDIESLAKLTRLIEAAKSGKVWTSDLGEKYTIEFYQLQKVLQ